MGVALLGKTLVSLNLHGFVLVFCFVVCLVSERIVIALTEGVSMNTHVPLIHECSDILVAWSMYLRAGKNESVG